MGKNESRWLDTCTPRLPVLPSHGPWASDRRSIKRASQCPGQAWWLQARRSSRQHSAVHWHWVSLSDSSVSVCVLCTVYCVLYATWKMDYIGYAITDTARCLFGHAGNLQNCTRRRRSTRSRVLCRIVTRIYHYTLSKLMSDVCDERRARRVGAIIVFDLTTPLQLNRNCQL